MRAVCRNQMCTDSEGNSPVHTGCWSNDHGRCWHVLHGTEMTQGSCNHFICTSCGIEVFSFPALETPPTKCATCVWLDEYIKDPVERSQLLKSLGRDGGHHSSNETC